MVYYLLEVYLCRLGVLIYFHDRFSIYKQFNIYFYTKPIIITSKHIIFIAFCNYQIYIQPLMITEPDTLNYNKEKHQSKQQSHQSQQKYQPQSPTRKRPNHLKLIRQNSYSPYFQSQQSFPDSDLISQTLMTQKFRQLAKTFTLPDINTKAFRQSFKQIMESFSSLDSFTQNMQQKVDLLLKQQQNQFVQSYTQHMKKIKKQFSNIQKKIEAYEQKIKYYENQGKMSHLVIKVSKLEQECKNLYLVIDNKQRELKERDLTIKVIRSQIKRLQKQMKILIREKNENKLTKELQYQMSGMKIALGNKLKSQQDQDQVFLKQFPGSLDNSKTMLSKNQTTINFLDQININRSSINKKNVNAFKNGEASIKNQISQKSITCDISLGSAKIYHKNEGSPVSKQISTDQKIKSQYKKQLLLLKKKNQLLNSFQSHVLDEKTSLQSFFLQCVNQIKQQILHRSQKNQNSKKNYCTFQDFKNEDKIQLMIKIISNQKILEHLYQRLFNNKITTNSLNLKQQEPKQLKKLKSISTTHKNVSFFRQTERVGIKNKKREKSQIQGENLIKNGSLYSVLPKIQFNLQY